MSSTYTTEIEGDEGFTYVGDAIITNTKIIQIIRNQALLNLTNTLETFLKEKPSGIEQLPLKDQPHKLFELLLKQEQNELKTLTDKTNSIIRIINELKNSNSTKWSDKEKAHVQEIRNTIQELSNKYLNRADILNNFYSTQDKSLISLTIKELASTAFLNTTDLTNLKTIIDYYHQNISDLNTRITELSHIPNLFTDGGSKRKKTQHTVKKDKKLAKLYKKVKTMKYKKL